MSFRLADGRQGRLLGKFNQEQMFSLRSDGLLLPPEGLFTRATMADLDTIRKCTGASPTDAMRSGRYAVHSRGFIEGRQVEIGDIVTWAENESRFSFVIPDVWHPSEPSKRLREAIGILDFDLHSLQFDGSTGVVSAAPHFNYARDVRVFSSAIASSKFFGASSIHFRPECLFHKDSNGWHGSVTFYLPGNVAPEIGICGSWLSQTLVAAVTKQATIEVTGVSPEELERLLAEGHVAAAKLQYVIEPPIRDPIQALARALSSAKIR